MFQAFIKNLPFDATESMVMESLWQLGVTRCHVLKDGERSRGCCFVSFDNERQWEDFFLIKEIKLGSRLCIIERPHLRNARNEIVG